MAASFVKFEKFITALAAGTHAAGLNADTDTYKVALSNTAPDVVNHTVLTAEIAGGNGYTAGGIDILNTATETGGIISVVAGQDPAVWTATGALGPFRYVILHNSSQANAVVGYWDYGAAGITLQSGETFSVDFGATVFTVGS